MFAPIATSDGCEQLRLELMEAIEHHVGTRTEMEDMSKKLAALEIERIALEERHVTLAATVEEKVNIYAQAKCRAFCGVVYCRFPREIRDLIYAFVHPAHLIRIAKDDVSGKTNPAWVNPGLSDRSHWWNESFVGKEMQLELHEHFFRSATFSFGSNFKLLSKFRGLSHRHWNTEYTPAQFMANIEVAINCDAYEFSVRDEDESSAEQESDGWGSHSWGFDSRKRRRTRFDLLADLELLFGFRAGTRINIYVTQRHDYEPGYLERTVDQIVPLIHPTLQRYQMSGYLTNVSFPDIYSWDSLPCFRIEGAMSFEACKNALKRFKLQEQKQQATTAKLWAGGAASDNGMGDEEVV